MKKSHCHILESNAPFLKIKVLFTYESFDVKSLVEIGPMVHGRIFKILSTYYLGIYLFGNAWAEPFILTNMNPFQQTVICVKFG